jgi:pyruvate/2-oxoacid:ferredoxin oxidoreductase alpha subunit
MPGMQATPDIVQQTMNDVASLTGRPLRLFDYYGHPEAERVVVAMGSSTSVLQEAADYLNARGERIGVVTVSGVLCFVLCIRTNDEVSRIAIVLLLRRNCVFAC